MPRRLRLNEPGTVYHLISRFVAREWFIPSAEERRAYLSLLGFNIKASDWRCFSYAIMSNHIHLGLVAGFEPLASWLRPVHTGFAQWVNERRERIGAVFTRGPNLIGVIPDGVARLISYIHCNPVRAGVVADPSESDWTSHRAYLGVEYRRSWLDVKLGLELAGFRDANEMHRWVIDVGCDRAALKEALIAPSRKPGRPRARS